MLFPAAFHFNSRVALEVDTSYLRARLGLGEDNEIAVNRLDRQVAVRWYVEPVTRDWGIELMPVIESGQTVTFTVEVEPWDDGGEPEPRHIEMSVELGDTETEIDASGGLSGSIQFAAKTLFVDEAGKTTLQFTIA